MRSFAEDLQRDRRGDSRRSSHWKLEAGASNTSRTRTACRRPRRAGTGGRRACRSAADSSRRRCCECHSGLPVDASCATMLPPPSPAKTSLPAVVSTPPPPPAPPSYLCRHAALPGLVVDRGQEAAARCRRAIPRLPAEPHRAARIGVESGRRSSRRCSRRRRTGRCRDEDAGGSQLIVPPARRRHERAADRRHPSPGCASAGPSRRGP